MHIRKLSSRQGSALLTVVMLIALMAILTGSMLNYTLSERRGNERNRLILRSKNMAENVALYSAEQISTKLHRLKTVSTMQFASGSNQLYLPPSDVLTIPPYSTASGVETYAGIISSTPLSLVTDPTNANYGLQVLTANVPIISKSTMSHPALGSITTYAEQDLQVSEVPLFQFAIFYDPDLEFAPGANMTISGPVNTNGNLIARDQTGFSNSVSFTARVTSVGGFFANTGYKGTTYNEYDTADTGPGGTGPLNFQNAAGTVTNIQSSGGVWRDHLYGGTSVTTTSVANFKTFATTSYGGYFQTSAMGVAPLTLPGIDTTAANSARTVIEAPDASDSTDVITAGTQFSRKAGLYIIANPTGQTRTGKLPNSTTVSMRAYSYRCWLNTTNTDQTHTLAEVILPGQPSYGALNANVNNLPNSYRVDTSVGSNQVLRIPQGAGVDLADTGYATGTPTMAAFQDAYFYDMRRATNSNGHPFSRTTLPFTPRPIAKIDFDMTRFHMAFDRTYSAATTSTVYYPALPSDATTWSHSILKDANASSPPTTAAYGLGMGSSYNTFGAQITLPTVQRAVSGAYFPTSVALGNSTQVGAAAATTYAGRYIIAETTTAATGLNTSANLTSATWTNVYTSSGDESSYTYTPSAGVTYVRIRTYLGGANPVVTDDGSAPATTRLIDQQIIPVSDASTTTVTASLSQDYLVVPTTATGTSPLLGNAVSAMRVFVGGIEDTANWAFSASTTNVTGSFGTGPQDNSYTVATITANTGSVTITATRSGYTTQARTFSLVKQSYDTLLASATAQTGYWTSTTSLPGPDPFQIYYAPANPADPLIKTNPASFAVTGTNLYNGGSGPWFDGVAIYVHSTEAEDLSTTSGVRNRMDSGVRLWNGKGPAASFTATGTTGFSFCTNDPVYIVGHFNADGYINSTTTATGNGGYSALYPDTANEYLAAVMGDSVTILSQPVYTTRTTGSGASAVTYYEQAGGWSDAFSATRGRNTNYSTSWATTNPSSSNSVDGLSNNVTPTIMPNLGNIASNASGASSANVQPAPTKTEVSACLLAGIVPTNSHQNSGGAHNFPRLLENWDGTPLYIRGSMVAMFASEIATEPWSIRIYSGAERDWGLHTSLTNARHDLPLEPMVISATRLAYRELSATDYATMKTTILALPIP